MPVTSVELFIDGCHLAIGKDPKGHSYNNDGSKSGRNSRSNFPIIHFLSFFVLNKTFVVLIVRRTSGLIGCEVLIGGVDASIVGFELYLRSAFERAPHFG